MQELLTMLESKYKRLEYIGIRTSGSQSSGGYIDTLYTPTLNTKVRVIFSPISRNNAGYFGARKDPFRFACITFSGGTQFAFAVTNNTFSSNRTTFNLNSIYDCVAENGKQIINGTEYNETIVENWGDCGTFLLSKITSSDTTVYSNANYHLCQIWESGVLVRNMIPVMRKSDNEIGMLDLVEGKFYTNAGTGKFTANLDTMYALIQGTPTVQDGRVSGFSSSNYLKIGQISTVQNRLERQVKIKTSNTTGSTQTIMSTGGYAGIRINDSNQIGTIVYINGSYSNFTLNTVLNGNTEYIYKDIFENGTLTIYLYNYQMVLLETKSVSIGFDENTNYNLGQSSGRIFTGTIDLNRSYIKIGTTKYNLQAVVGYTKVGSPTITDGVVSGFSAKNFLTLNSFNMSSNWEILIKIKQNTLPSDIVHLFRFVGAYATVFALNKNNGRDSFVVTCHDTDNVRKGLSVGVTNYYPTANSWYLLKFGKNENILYHSSSIDNGQSWVSKSIEIPEGYTIDPFTSLNIGAGADGSLPFTDGEIDFNSSYIKINNKLWFNGLPNN